MMVTERQPPLTLTHLRQNDQYFNLPYVAILHRELTESNHNLMYTVDHIFGYHSKKFICTCVKLSAHAHGTEISGLNFKQFKTSIGFAR